MNSNRTTSIDFTAFEVREKHIDLNREALLHIAGRDGIETLILRVQTFGPTGRPSSRTLRLNVAQLREPEAPLEY